MKLFRYKRGLFGRFDYERYKNVQIAGNIRKNNLQWVTEDTIRHLAEYIKKTMGNVEFGLCHGTRRGLEQKVFQEALCCEVIGTEISPTAADFPFTIQWDFHEVKEEWKERCDFIYSNSWDHSYDRTNSFTRGFLASGLAVYAFLNTPDRIQQRV